ncbi:MATE family efflux transporter [Lederbergia wuyishanensis]|uniref:MATE family efflux protein n=1 Tax=Lederbergia wuyishanensis TaxID=1347903 RepID=A0ABU0D0D7_9BACI|nr:MATE family efflux transporter [Lederbergia wuyishanensis]MCJ8006492.1 MATE family efflux transporter [Lederbergia wuyishanensis]MDQ0341868.1 putative MATE family efflux protein [Lederbergia wuyishanensis]
MSLFVREKSFYKTFFTLTVIIGLQNVITFGINLSDNLMIGGYSESALSGVALANQIQFVLQMLVMGVGEGMVIMSARYWGAKNIGSIKKISSIGMRISILVGLVMWAIIFFFPEAVLSLFTNDVNVIAEGTNYLKIICFSYIFFSITSILVAILRSVETVKIGFILSTSTLIINVCLNYILIYGHFGFPSLGVQGAAIATLTSRIIELIIIIIFVKRFDQKIYLKLRDFLQFELDLFKQYINLGSPIIMSNFIWGLAMAVQTAILGHMGAAAIAANSIATTIFGIVAVAVFASASATTVLIGKTIGEGNVNKIKSYAKTLQILYLIIGFCTGIILFFTKDFVLDFYTISTEARSLALQFMTVLSITVCGTAYQMPALTGIVRSGGDTKFVLINDTIFMWMIVLPASALCAFVFELSPLITFICLKSDQILKCFVAIVKVNRFKWIRTFDSAADEMEEKVLKAN